MARASTIKGAPPAETVLPLPPALLSFHRQTLDPTLNQWRQSGNIPPVLLLTGPQGIGKRQISHWLAQWLLCERSGFSPSLNQDASQVEGDPTLDLFGGGPPEPSSHAASVKSEEPCDHCGSCTRALGNLWVDFKEIHSVDDDGESGSLKIDQFRDLKETMGYGGSAGGYRITLIRDADRMTLQAANSLLKILEEPPPGWLFFLTAADSSTLLPTLVSRCQTLRLRPLTRPTIESLLTQAQVSTDRKSVCADLAQGSLTRALALATDETWEKRSQVLRFFENPGAELSGLMDWGAQSPTATALLLDHLEQSLQILIAWSLSPKQAQLPMSLKNHADHQIALLRKKGLSPEASLEQVRTFWTERAERSFRARAQALTPMNKKILLQDLLMAFLAT